MKNINQIIILTLLLSFQLVGNAQNKSFKAENFTDKTEEFKIALQNIESGNLHYKNYPNDAKLALDSYLKANKFNHENANLNYKIGMCYLAIEETGKSISHLEKSISLDSQKGKKIHSHLAKAYKLETNFEKAETNFSEYKNSLPWYRWNWKKEAKLPIGQCKSGKKLMENPVDISISNIGEVVNTKFNDYSPSILETENKLFFISEVETPDLKRAILNIISVERQVYFSKVVNNELTTPRKLKQNASLPRLGTRFILTHNHKARTFSTLEDKGDIAISEFKDGEWSDSEVLPQGINTKHTEQSAVISNDGNTIYFSSNRNKKMGFDIFVSHKNKNGKWSAPVALGTEINTKYDEKDVFLHSDGNTLYFSSNSTKSMGGYDIFKSQKRMDSLWTESENIGYPINSPYDDVTFHMPSNGAHAYFASNRKGGFGKLDIYKTTLTDDIAFLTSIKGRVFDKDTNEPCIAMITVFDADQNFIGTGITEMDGTYEIAVPAGVDHLIYADSPSFLFFSEKFTVKKTKSMTVINKDIALSVPLEGAKVTLGAMTFDTNTSDLKPSSFSTLDQIVDYLTKNYELKIEISGHTDNVGNKKKNQLLSEERAKSVEKYLLEKGISQDRLQSKGYGFSQPLETNSTKEGRRKNRRVEFKILGK